jgi:hypothetical protein
MNAAGLSTPSISETFLSRIAISVHSPCLDIKSHSSEFEYARGKNAKKTNNPQHHSTENRRLLKSLLYLHLTTKLCDVDGSPRKAARV